MSLTRVVSAAAGADGSDGREVQLQTTGTHVQWRYAGDVSWTDLVSLATITGPAGSNGTNGSDGAAGLNGADGSDGREVELQTSATHVQWRYVGGPSWVDLVPLATITGPAGTNGADGASGVGLPTGGLAGQILGKATATDYDTAWIAPPAPGLSGADPLPLTVQASVPAAPAAGTVLVYARARGGRSFLEMIGASGVDTALQPALFGNRIATWNPNTTTTVSSFGGAPAISATASHPALNANTLAESIYRTRFQTSATAGNSSGVRDVTATVWRGNAAGRGGFFLHHRFCSGSISLAGGQKFTGLTSQTTALAVEPSALPNVLGMLKDSGDTNWHFARRTGTGTVQKVDLGVAAAVNQTFDMILFSRPNGSEVFVRIVQHAYDGSNTVLLDTSYSDNLPAVTTFLARQHHVRNGATAAADNFELIRSYLESDY